MPVPGSLRKRIVSSLSRSIAEIGKLGRGMRELQHRESQRVRDEMAGTRQLIPLLMKQRNGTKWTAEERRNIQKYLRRIAGVSPYLVLFVMPGGFFMLPLLAWWLDKRRQRRDQRRAKT